jgi:leucyl aminopeptidase
MRLLVLLALVACSGDADQLVDGDADTDTDTDADTDVDAVAPDPLDVGRGVTEAELTATISDLQALGTRYTFTDGDEAARDYLVDRLEDLGLVAELDPFDAGYGAEATNIIARHPGRDPSIVWILSAHYDSTSTSPETVAPGADDNASGVAWVLAAARLLSAHRFEHSVWFVMTAAEEQGSLGSAHMVEWLADEPIEVRGVIAPDMIGYWPAGDADAFDILGDSDSTHLVTHMSEIADEMGVAHKTWIQHDYCYGDDHTNFQEAGFPAITPMDCVEAHNVYGSGESLPHYHHTSDTLDTLHMPFMTRVSQVLTATAADLAEPLPPSQ